MQSLSKNQLLLVATAMLSVYGVGQIWLVQLSSYHLWEFVGPQEFQRYHWEWWRSIWGPVMVPTSLVFLGAMLMLWKRPNAVPSWAVWLGAALEVAIALGTAIWWGPLMARLADEHGRMIQLLYRQLMLTHWIRVALVTAYGFLAAWMLVTSISLSPRQEH